VATLNSVTAQPTSLTSGQQATITPSITLNPGQPARTAHVVVDVGGQAGIADVTLAATQSETISFTTDPAKRGMSGWCYASADVGTLAATTSGFVYTAP
jgi:hypothetical protein